MTTPITPTAAVPANGVKPATAATPAVPAATPAAAPPPDATAAELKQWRERAEKAEQTAAQKTREEIINRRKYEGERKTFAEKLKLADEHAQLLKHAGINPAAVAKKLWGDQWYEKLTAINVNGGAPTADSIALEMETREQALRKEFDERDQKRVQAQQQAEQRALDARVRNFKGELLEAVKAKGAEFPLTAQQFKTPEQHAEAVFNFIVNEHARTTQKDPETGEVLRQGRAMSFDEAAAALEEQLYGIAERAAADPKYVEKLRAKLTPPKTPGTVPSVVKSSPVLQQGQSSQSSQQARRTLGNDLTGSTPPAPSTYRSEEQRTADALAAYERTKKT